MLGRLIAFLWSAAEYLLGKFIVKFIEWCQANLKLIKRIGYLVMFLFVATDFFVPRHHVHFFGDKIPGFWSAFGFVACILVIAVPKWLGHIWLYKDEDYYED